jgi:hypothetical protein
VSVVWCCGEVVLHEYGDGPDVGFCSSAASDCSGFAGGGVVIGWFGVPYQGCYVRQDWLPEAELVISRVLRSPTIAALLVDAMVDRELGGSRV